MFYYQKKNFEVIRPKCLEDFTKQWAGEKVDYVCFDTETDGLSIKQSYPFLYVLGFNKKLFLIHTVNKENKNLVKDIVDFLSSKNAILFAHNAKFDYHMTLNLLGLERYDNLDTIIADSFTVVRLSSYSDDELLKLSLESIGEKFVDKNAKFAGKIIKDLINKNNSKIRNDLKVMFQDMFPKMNYRKSFEIYKKRIQYLPIDLPKEVVDFFDIFYYESTYLDIWKLEPELMENYALDDVAILIDYLQKALPITRKTDPKGVVINRERKIIPTTARMERNGLKLDIDYLIKSGEIVTEYKDKLYKEFYNLMGQVVSVGQHELLKKIYKERFDIHLEKADKEAFKKVSTDNPQAQRSIAILKQLRTIDKWLSTYIYGKLNEAENGYFYTSVNNSGAVSGRVSCNMQQQPKEPLLDEDGNELFHPRKAFIPEEDYSLFFLDFSQMELRMQAYYTMLCGEGDLNLCRAYIPFRCINEFTGEYFNPNNDEMLKEWNSGHWVLEENTDIKWTPTDLHTVTTFNAFPFLNNDKSHPEFSHYRKLGKICNFLKNYQGGVGALMETLDIPEDIAKSLDEAYYKSFPAVRDYQNWVNNQLKQYGFVENLYGRRYYMKESKHYYKACNYVIQGGCADMVKKAEIRIDELLKDKKSKFLLPIHDEVMIGIHKDEFYLVPIIRDILQDCKDVMPLIPMISDVEIATKNWGEKEDYEC